MAGSSPSQPGPDVPRPEAAHLKDDDAISRTGSPPRRRDPNLEATELEDYSRPSMSEQYEQQEHGQEEEAEPAQNGGGGDSETEALPRPRLRRLPTAASHRDDNAVRKFWRRQIRVSVPHEDCRDHLACERTFLGYIRTSVALSMLGVTVAQLFRLQQSPTPGTNLGFYELGQPLSALFISAAIFVTLLGGWRFWRLQNAMVRRKIIAAGWELHVVAFVVGSLMLVVLVLTLAVSPAKDPLPGEGEGDGSGGGGNGSAGGR